jgi:YD repeat-containing protein
MTQDATGVRLWLLYDDIGRKVADVDSTGTLTEYSYDKNDRLTRSIVYATAVNTSTLVDASGNPTNVLLATIRPTANAGDQKSWRAYDTAGRLVKTVDAVGAVTERFYDGASALSQDHRLRQPDLDRQPDRHPDPGLDRPDRQRRGRPDHPHLLRQRRPLVGSLDGEGYLSENQYDAAGRLSVALRYATVTATAQQATGTLAQLRPATSATTRRTSSSTTPRVRSPASSTPRATSPRRSTTSTPT